jgi:hypothetical protein
MELGFLIGSLNCSYFKAPYLNWNNANLDPTLQKKVEDNMYTLQVKVEIYEIDNYKFPGNSKISMVPDSILSDFVNPYTNKKGLGNAIVSGFPRKKGVLGFKSNKDGSYYEIYGYGVNWILTHKEKIRLGK